MRCGEVSPSHGFAVPAPFRQGAEGTDCHTSDIGHWSRNDTLQVVRYGGPMWASTPTEALQGVRCVVGGRTEASAPTEGLGVREAGDRKGRPYGDYLKFLDGR